MTDPEEIARGIASTAAQLFNCLQLSRQDKENYEAVVQEIAAALHKAYAEGYHRGIEECVKLAESMYATQFHGLVERRTSKKIAVNLQALLQRGTGGGE